MVGMSKFDQVAEAIRLELAKGAYQMPYDTLPYETKSKVIAQALLSAGLTK